MELVEETYDRKKMSITYNHMGNLGQKSSTIFPATCAMKSFFLKLRKNKLASVTNINIIGSWDTKKISVKYLDMAGCFFPWEKHVHAVPND